MELGKEGREHGINRTIAGFCSILAAPRSLFGLEGHGEGDLMATRRCLRFLAAS